MKDAISIARSTGISAAFRKRKRFRHSLYGPGWQASPALVPFEGSRMRRNGGCPGNSRARGPGAAFGSNRPRRQLCVQLERIRVKQQVNLSPNRLVCRVNSASDIPRAARRRACVVRVEDRRNHAHEQDARTPRDHDSSSRQTHERLRHRQASYRFSAMVEMKRGRRQKAQPYTLRCAFPVQQGFVDLSAIAQNCTIHFELSARRCQSL